MFISYSKYQGRCNRYNGDCAANTLMTHSWCGLDTCMYTTWRKNQGTQGDCRWTSELTTGVQVPASIIEIEFNPNTCFTDRNGCQSSNDCPTQWGRCSYKMQGSSSVQCNFCNTGTYALYSNVCVTSDNIHIQDSVLPDGNSNKLICQDLCTENDYCSGFNWYEAGRDGNRCWHVLSGVADHGCSHTQCDQFPDALCYVKI